MLALAAHATRLTFFSRLITRAVGFASRHLLDYAADPADRIQTQNTTAATVGPCRLLWQAPFQGCARILAHPRVSWVVFDLRLDASTRSLISTSPRLVICLSLLTFRIGFVAFLLTVAESLAHEADEDYSAVQRPPPASTW